MEHGVHPFLLLAQAIEDGTYGVGNAASQKQQESGQGEHLKCLLGEGDDCPAHANVADHGEHAVFLQVNGGEGGGQGGHGPFKAEQ